jgi:hypothetical protein
MDDINARHTAEMNTLIERLESEQLRMNETLQARLDSMRDMSLSAKLSADSLTSASDAGRNTIEALAEAATLADDAVKQRFTEMEEMVRFSNSKAESITDRAAKRVRDSLTLTRLEISRIEDDMRELEQRLGQNSGDFQRRDPVLDVTPKSNWRKSLLRFRPVGDEAIIDVEPEVAATPEAIKNTPPALELTSPPDISLSERMDPLLEPEDTTLEIPHPGTTEKPPIKQPITLSAPVDIPARRAADIIDDNLALEIPEPLQMDLPSTEPLAAPIAQASLSASRIDAPQLRPRKAKSGWMRNFFGGGKEETPQGQAPVMGWPQLCEDVDTRLSAIGLAPNAVVEAGCIIEAVNTRVSKGAAPMRDIVALRLPQPIAHLRESFEADPSLRAACMDFATRYYQIIGPLESNREGLRVELESKIGRAYILCDAALG